MKIIPTRFPITVELTEVEAWALLHISRGIINTDAGQMPQEVIDNITVIVDMSDLLLEELEP